MIYYVEDDTNIRNLTMYALKQAGFESRGFSHARDFFAACKKELPSMVLLDIMLPETDGLEILRQIRSNTTMKRIPVMMLTAKGTEFDTVSGLDAGADDYLAKPFGMMELVARVNALARRVEEESPRGEDILTCGRLVLSISAHSVEFDGMPVTLTLKEFDLLRMLMQNQGHVLTREKLLEEVWGIDSVVIGETRTVDVHIQTLRQKISQVLPGGEQYIQTVRGVGYCVKEPADQNRSSV
ncbi:MAG: response regulator transcription factor [Raoultibacter sp.]|jgi:two-component system alkaline phosphatase synthesis response regulator PhoP